MTDREFLEAISAKLENNSQWLALHEAIEDHLADKGESLAGLPSRFTKAYIRLLGTTIQVEFDSMDAGMKVCIGQYGEWESPEVITRYNVYETEAEHRTLEALGLYSRDNNR